MVVSTGHGEGSCGRRGGVLELAPTPPGIPASDLANLAFAVCMSRLPPQEAAVEPAAPRRRHRSIRVRRALLDAAD